MRQLQVTVPSIFFILLFTVCVPSTTFDELVCSIFPPLPPGVHLLLLLLRPVVRIEIACSFVCQFGSSLRAPLAAWSELLKLIKCLDLFFVSRVCKG